MSFNASRFPQATISPSTSTQRNFSAQYQGASSDDLGSVNVLSVPDTLKMHVHWALSGLVDACRWDVVVRVLSEDAEIRANVLKSTLLNSLSLVAIYAFDLFLVPLLGLSRSQIDMNEFSQPEHWVHRNIGVFYTVLFQLPVVVGALYLNGTWSAVIAKRIYALQHGRSTPTSTSFSTGSSSHDRILTALSSNAYRAVLIVSTVTLSFILGYIPYVGQIASFVFMCWVDAYYLFEFIWTARGHSLPQRLRLEEERWSYFFAFGIPSAAVCLWGSSLANAALFALLFPAFVIMAIHAHPVPVSPYTPIDPYRRGLEVAVQPSPSVPVRLPIFAIPLLMHDLTQRVIVEFGPRASGRGSGGWKKSFQDVGDAYGLGGKGASLESIEEGASSGSDERRRGYPASGGGAWQTYPGSNNGFVPYAGATRLRAKKID